MRYKVVTHNVAGITVWGIEDTTLTPRLREAGMSPALCSVDSETPLAFGYMTAAYRWLARCERAGLDMGDEAGMFTIYTDAEAQASGGTVKVNKVPGYAPGPVVREVDESWRSFG